MPSGDSRDKPRKATRRRRASAARAKRGDRFAPSPAAPAEKSAEARALYHHEKARRAHATRPPDHPLEQARRAYQALLASDAEKAKGGRPKKNAAPKRAGRTSARDDESDVED